MKPIEGQTYYEILEVRPNATPKEIQRAYEHVKETFRKDSLAVYSLFSDEEIGKIQAAIEEAYRVLMDDSSRKRYDQSHLRMIEEKQDKGNYKKEGTPTDIKSSLSFTELSIPPEEEPYRGRRLKEIRERMGVDLKTISLETKINIKILECIEEEAVERLPAIVYLKGFLRSYARFLGLDPQRVIEGYLSLFKEEKKK